LRRRSVNLAELVMHSVGKLRLAGLEVNSRVKNLSNLKNF
jgi:hypothetical protein